MSLLGGALLEVLGLSSAQKYLEQLQALTPDAWEATQVYAKTTVGSCLFMVLGALLIFKGPPLLRSLLWGIAGLVGAALTYAATGWMHEQGWMVWIPVSWRVWVIPIIPLLAFIILARITMTNYQRVIFVLRLASGITVAFTLAFAFMDIAKSLELDGHHWNVHIPCLQGVGEQQCLAGAVVGAGVIFATTLWLLGTARAALLITLVGVPIGFYITGIALPSSVTENIPENVTNLAETISSKASEITANLNSTHIHNTLLENTRPIATTLGATFPIREVAIDVSTLAYCIASFSGILFVWRFATTKVVENGLTFLLGIGLIQKGFLQIIEAGFTQTQLFAGFIIAACVAGYLAPEEKVNATAKEVKAFGKKLVRRMSATTVDLTKVEDHES